jgi:hypothetical protein
MLHALISCEPPFKRFHRLLVAAKLQISLNRFNCDETILPRFPTRPDSRWTCTNWAFPSAAFPLN